MNLTDIRPGEAIEIGDLAESLRKICKLCYAADDYGEILLNKIIKHGIIKEIEHPYYAMDGRFSAFRGSRTYINPVEDIIKFGFYRIDYINVKKKWLFGTKKEKSPTYNTRLQKLRKNIENELTEYKKPAESKKTDESLTHLMRALALSGVVKRHNCMFNDTVLAEFYYYYENGFYQKALEIANIMADKEEMSKTIGPHLVKIFRKIHENIEDEYNYNWTGTLQKTSAGFHKCNNELDLEWIKIFFDCTEDNLKFDIKNSTLYVSAGNRKANNYCLKDYTSGIWIYDLPPHRIRDLRGSAFIDFLDDNSKAIKTMSYEEFKRVWPDEKKRNEVIPSNPKNMENKHIGLVFS